MPGRVGNATVLAVGSFGAFLAFLDATIVNVAFPSIQRSFAGTSLSELSWVLNAYNVVFAAFLIVCGRLADLIGRRRTFLAGIVIFTLASAICGAAGSVDVLIAGRIVQAFGAALLVPASLALVVHAFSVERRAHAVGLWGSAAAVAAGLGPPLGGALVELGGWRWAFWINLPIGIAAAAVARVSLVESRAQGRRRLPDLRGAGLLAAALGLLTLGIVQGHDWGWTTVGVIGTLAGSLVGFALFAASSARHPSPLLDGALLRTRAFAVTNVASITAGMGFYAYLLTNIFWLQYVWRYSVLAAGGALVPGALVAAVTAAVVGPLAERYGHRYVVVPGALVWAGAYVWYFERVGPHADFLGVWLPGQALSGIGAGAVLPILASAALGAVPGGRFATASAVVTSSRQLGGVLGVAFLVVIIGTPTAGDLAHAIRNGWVLCIVCFAVTAVVSMTMGRVALTDERPADSGRASPRIHLPGHVDDEQRPADARVDAPTIRQQPNLLAELPDDIRQQLEDVATRRVVPAGTWLIAEGSDADSAFVLLSGRMEASRQGTFLNDLRPGAIIGELGLLTEGTRTASVRARRDSTVLEISRADFQRIIFGSREALVPLVHTIADRLARPQRATQHGESQPSVIAVVAAHPGAATDSVGDVLSHALADAGSLFTSRGLDLMALQQAELDNDRVLLVADGRDAEWAQFCIRQADFLLLVGASGADPVERALPRRPDLLLVGPPPSNDALRAWSSALHAGRITTSSSADLPAAMRPIVSRLAGQSLGIVLAGGGARALAQIGVLQELADAGLHIDRVVGCSMGAIVGALWGRGLNGAGVEEVIYAEMVRRNPIGDYAVPTKSISRGRRLDDAVLRSFGDAPPIEAFPRMFACVSTDLRSRSRVVHDRGDAVLAVRASSRIPGVFPPIRTDDQLLVDGSILDNMPFDLLVSRNEGPVIAVNIGVGGNTEGSKRPAGQRGEARTLALGETLLRTLLISSSGASDDALAAGAYVVSPRVDGVGLLEFHQLDVMVEAGRAAARDLLDLTGGNFVARQSAGG